MTTYDAAEAFCLGRSWRLRLRPADSRWLIRLAVEQLPPGPVCESAGRALAGELRSSLAASVRARYASPLVVWVLLNVVVPIVVRLVIEWWLRRKEA